MGRVTGLKKVTVEVRRAPLAKKQNSLEKKTGFEVKNCWTHTKQLPTNLGALSEVFNCLVVFHLTLS